MIPKALKRVFAAKQAPARKASGRKPQAPSDRDKLLGDAMAVYRQQRQDVYDSLDEDTRRQIEEDAEKAFGGVLRGKD
jgi:hypothetical protein